MYTRNDEKRKTTMQNERKCWWSPLIIYRWRTSSSCWCVSIEVKMKITEIDWWARTPRTRQTTQNNNNHAKLYNMKWVTWIDNKSVRASFSNAFAEEKKKTNERNENRKFQFIDGHVDRNKRANNWWWRWFENTENENENEKKRLELFQYLKLKKNRNFID